MPQILQRGYLLPTEADMQTHTHTQKLPKILSHTCTHQRAHSINIRAPPLTHLALLCNRWVTSLNANKMKPKSQYLAEHTPTHEHTYVNKSIYLVLRPFTVTCAASPCVRFASCHFIISCHFPLGLQAPGRHAGTWRGHICCF